MKLSNPNAPATSKQLYYLHLLTKQDTRDWKLTMEEASDKISELKGNGDNKVRPTKRQEQYYLLTVFRPSEHRMSNGKYKVLCDYHTGNYGKARYRFDETKRQRKYAFNLDLYAYVFAQGSSLTPIQTQLANGNFTENKSFKILEVDYCSEVMPPQQDDRQQVKTKSTPLFTSVDAEKVFARRIDIHQAETYVKRIRNRPKRDYAESYLQYLLGKAKEPAIPEAPYLPFMASQAVRIHLDGILK